MAAMMPGERIQALFANVCPSFAGIHTLVYLLAQGLYCALSTDIWMVQIWDYSVKG
jgi:hypothetical protein